MNNNVQTNQRICVTYRIAPLTSLLNEIHSNALFRAEELLKNPIVIEKKGFGLVESLVNI